MTTALQFLPLVKPATRHLRPEDVVKIPLPANADAPAPRPLVVFSPTQLFVLKLLGGLAVPAFLALLLLAIPARQPAPLVDLSLPAPALSLAADEPAEAPEAEAAPRTVPLSAANFRFEYFAQVNNGRLRLFNTMAEGHMRRWYPAGVPVTNFLRFLSVTLQESGLSAEETRRSCVSIPQNKAFRQATITCTYQHPLPASLNQPKARVFWIVAVSYDSKKLLRNIQVHGRLTRVP